jgi:hypothetical protein
MLAKLQRHNLYKDHSFFFSVAVGARIARNIVVDSKP